MSGRRVTVLISIFIIIVLILSGAFLRFYDLGGKSLWYDEIFELHVSSHNLTYITRSVHPLHSPLNQFINHFFLAWGKKEFNLRLSSALWGILGIWAIYLAGAIVFGRKEGLIGAFLLTISSYHIRYSQEARMYTLVVLTSLLSIYFFWRALERNEKKAWFGYIIFTTLALYTHLSVFFIIFSQFIFVCLSLFFGLFTAKKHQLKERGGWFFFSLFCILLIFIPRIIPAIRAAFFDSKPWLVINAGPLSQAGEGSGIKVTRLYTFLSLYGAGTGVALYIYSSLFLLGVIGSIRKMLIPISYLLLSIFLPFLIFTLLSPSHTFSPRYVIFLLPIGYLVVAKGISSLEQLSSLMARSSRLKKFYPLIFYSLITTLFVLLNIRPLKAYYIESRDPDGRLFKLDWRGVGSYLEENASPGDAVVAGGPSPYYNMVCLRQYLSPELQARLSLIDPTQLKEAGIWRIGRTPEKRPYPAGMEQSALQPSLPGINISYGRGPVNLRRKEISPFSLEKGTKKIPVVPEKRFFLSVWIKGVERHFERFSPYPSLHFYDSSSHPINAPDRGMVLITDQADGWKQYVLNGLIPAKSVYVQVCFQKYALHIGNKVIIDRVKFYGDW
jgi:Dolichyl-phosphate-mannose-protein mannosyltransferase